MCFVFRRFFSREKVVPIRDIMVEAHKLERKPEADELYSTDFLPRSW